MKNSKVRSLKKEKKWIVNLGAAQHMCHDLNLFSKEEQETISKNVFLGDSSMVPVELMGTVPLTLNLPNKTSIPINLRNVLGVPGLSKNLISISACMASKLDVYFDSSTLDCTFYDKGEVAGKAYPSGDLWILDAKMADQNMKISNHSVVTKEKVTNQMVDLLK